MTFSGVQAYLGINTTSKSASIPNIPTDLAADSGVVAFNADLTAGGLGIDGSFVLDIGAQSSTLSINASSNIFNASVSVTGTAAVYYGASGGLVLDVGLSTNLGGLTDNSGLFTISGDLALHIDSRAGSQQFYIGLNNASLKLLNVLEVQGSGSITLSDNYFKVQGSFTGTFLSVFTVSVSGSLDSAGDFDLNMLGNFQIGSNSWGINAGGSLHLTHDAATNKLALAASLQGSVLVAGYTLVGVGLNVDYNQNGDGAIYVDANVTVASINFSVGFTVGYISLSVPKSPELADELANPSGGETLELNVGSRLSLRNAGRDSSGNPDPNAAYTITSLGKGSQTGEKVLVQAFGAQQVFDNVTSIDGNFGRLAGNNQVVLGSGLGTFGTVAVTVEDAGTGNDTFINQSHANALFRSVSGASSSGGAGNVLISNTTLDQATQSTTYTNSLYGGAGAILKGGSGTNAFYWDTAAGTPASVTSSSIKDTLTVVGTDAANAFNLSASGSQLAVGVTTNGTTQTLDVSGIPSVVVQGLGGADTLSVNVGDMKSIGVTNVVADLDLVQGQQSAGSNPGTASLNLVSDNSTNSITLVGGNAGENAAITSVDSSKTDTKDVQVAVSEGGDTNADFTLTDEGPNAATDTLTYQAGSGTNVLNVSGTQSYPASEVDNRVQLVLKGGTGINTATVPFGVSSFVGSSSGTNALNIVADSTTAGPFTLTNNTASSKNSTTSYQNVGALTLDTTALGNTAVSVRLHRQRQHHPGHDRRHRRDQQHRRRVRPECHQRRHSRLRQHRRQHHRDRRQQQRRHLRQPRWQHHRDPGVGFSSVQQHQRRHNAEHHRRGSGPI